MYSGLPAGHSRSFSRTGFIDQRQTENQLKTQKLFPPEGAFSFMYHFLS
jgi:hypothetical protein